MLKIIYLSCVMTLSLSLNAYAKTPHVVTTIKPLHSLVSQIMDGVSEPALLIESGSVHGYHLKPSDIHGMSKADLIVWVSNDLETFMPDSIEKLGNVRTRIWQETDDVKRLTSHHEEGLEKTHDNDEHADHHHGKYNPHLWLGTENAAVLLKAVASDLSQIDSEHAAQYESNLKKALNELSLLENELQLTISNLENKPYMVFHDAYSHFETQFGLTPIAVVRVDPEHEPGVKRTAELQQILRNNQVVCIFNEPQFSSKLTEKLIKGTDVRVGVLDPIGADIPMGKTMFSTLQTNLAASLHDCLAFEKE